MNDSFTNDITLIALRFGRDRGRMAPLGALSLASSLTRAGQKWTLIDTQMMPEITPFGIDEFEELLRSVSSEVIGISVFNDAVPLLVCAMDRLGRSWRRRVVVGGPGVVGIARDLMERLPQLEAVVVGEAETALPQLVSGSRSELLGPGVYWRNSLGDIVGAGRTPREDLNAISSPAWEWCRDRNYRIIPLSTMRGCPFACEFCEIIAFMGRRVTRQHLLGAFASLRAAIACIDSTEVAVLDDTFTLSRRHVVEFCNGLAEQGLSINFSVFSRTDTIDEGQMELLASSGCRRVFFGVDAGDGAVLKSIRKGIDVAAAAHALRQAADYFPVTASFIWGYPFESFEAFEATIKICRELMNCGSRFPITPQLHLLSPSAGTPLFETYGADLRLDLSPETLVMDGGLSRWAKAGGYNNVLRVLKESPKLYAAFYRYETAEFARKMSIAQALDSEIMERVGSRIVGFLRNQAGESSGTRNGQRPENGFSVAPLG